MDSAGTILSVDLKHRTVGDNVYPQTMEKVCSGDVSISEEKGVIDVTDKCSEGYNESIVDGYVGVSGSFSAFLKYSETDGSLNTQQRAFLNRFYDIQTDDGAGVYTLVPKNDTDILLAILRNEDQAETVGNTQTWQMIPAILTGSTADAPLKGAQNQDLTWTKGEGAAALYERITNATEAVF